MERKINRRGGRRGEKRGFCRLAIPEINKAFFFENLLCFKLEFVKGRKCSLAVVYLTLRVGIYYGLD